MPYTLLVILHRCLRNIDKREQEYLFPECVSRLHMLKLVIGGIFYKVNSFPESDNYAIRIRLLLVWASVGVHLKGKFLMLFCL